MHPNLSVQYFIKMTTANFDHLNATILIILMQGCKELKPVPPNNYSKYYGRQCTAGCRKKMKIF